MRRHEVGARDDLWSGEIAGVEAEDWKIVLSTAPAPVPDLTV